MANTAEKTGKIPKIYKLPIDGIPKGYIDRIKVFNEYCRIKMGKREIDEQTVLDFFKLQSETKRANTVYNYLYSIKAAYIKICKTDLQILKVQRFFAQIERPRIVKRVSSNKVASKEDLLKAIEDEPIQWKLLIAFIFQHGLRVSEALSLRWLDLSDGKPGIVEAEIRGKGSKNRRIFCSKKTIDQIRSAFGSELYLFEFHRKTKINRDSVRKRIANAFKKKLNRKFTTHWLRHSRANQLLNSGESIRSVADYLGHSSPDITSAHYDQSGITPERMVHDELEI